MTIHINATPYEVPQQVADALERLKYERDYNYGQCVRLQSRLDAVSNKIRLLVKGVATCRVSKGQRELFR